MSSLEPLCRGNFLEASPIGFKKGAQKLQQWGNWLKKTATDCTLKTNFLKVAEKTEC
jgi:hypothetical protein